MKYIIDGMLGKLTRWLRMLGHNVKYSNKLGDKDLIKIAKMEKRILLTKDLELYQQAISHNVKAFYVEGRNEAERLANLARRFKLELEINVKKSRCTKCNTRIKLIEKDAIKGKIPKNTFLRYNKFWQCPKCEQVYWQGSHWKRINNTLYEARKILEANR